MLRRYLVRKREAALGQWLQDCHLVDVLQEVSTLNHALWDRRRSRARLRRWDFALDIFTLNGRI